MLSISPSLVVSDKNSNVFDIPEYAAVGISGDLIEDVSREYWIPLPEGSQLMELSGRLPVGLDRKSREIVVVEQNCSNELIAVAAFLSPAYTVTHLEPWIF